MGGRTRLEIIDQVNCRFHNLDPGTRRKLRSYLKFFIPWAPHSPKYKAGWWDGYEYLIDQGSRTYINLLDEILQPLIDLGWHVELDDKRPAFNFDFPTVDKNIFSHKTWPEKHKHSGEPIVLMEHQVDALNVYLNNTGCVYTLPTSGGKTLITAAMSYFAEPYGRTLVIVPNKGLVVQTEDDYKNLDLDVGVYFGDRKELDKTHTICTWQILNILNKKSKKHSRDDIERLSQLLDNVNVVIVDEVHQAKADALKKILSGPMAHVPIRWGLTGTLPKDKYDRAIIKAVIGPEVGTIKPKELQDKGILSNCDISIFQLEDPFEFKNYHDEMKYLIEDEKRLEWIAKFIKATSMDGNTLVLVNKIKTGEELEKLIDGSVFISGRMKVKDRRDHYDEVHELDDKPMIATYGVAAVGINVPRIFNLILVEPGKSFIRVVQSIGRSLRVAKDKDHARIFDITSTCKYSKRHLAERKKYYKEMEYPYTIDKVKWR